MKAYFAQRSYRAQSPDLADERLVNCYLERSPEGAKSQTPVIGSPGIVEYDDIGESPILGMHVAQLGNRKLLYVVAGDTLYSVDDTLTAGDPLTPNPTLTSIGTVKGRRRVSMCDNGAQLAIVNGLYQYVYDTTNGLQKLKFGLGMDGDYEIAHDHDGTSLTTVDLTLTLGPASANNLNEIIVTLTGDAATDTFTERPSSGDTITTVATALAATIDADANWAASSSAGVITVTPAGGNSTIDDVVTVATSYHHTITIGDSFKAGDYITLTFETVGNADVTFSHLVTTSDTRATIASALNTLIDADAKLTSTVGTAEGTTNVITVYGQTAGTHVVTDIYSDKDWAVISGQAPYAKQVWALDGYMLYPVSNTPSFMISNLNDASRIDVSDIASLSAAETNIVGMCVNQREIYLLGENYGSIWRNTGATGFPFTRIPGGHIERGCASPYTIAKGSNTWAWLGEDRRVYAMSGYKPTRISTHGIETLIEDMQKIDDAFAFVVTWKGHEWYVLTFPSEDLTVIYDTASGEWHERVSYTAPDLEDATGFCGVGYGMLWADRPNDPGVFISGVDGSVPSELIPGVILSDNGKNWRGHADTTLIDAEYTPATAHAIGYSRDLDKFIYADGLGQFASSVDGGLSWTEDVGITTDRSDFADYVSAWGLWLIGSKASNAVELRRSATGLTGSWTSISLSGLSITGNTNWGNMAYSSALSLGVIVGRNNGMLWSTNGTSWSDATTLPDGSSVYYWRSVVWAVDQAKFVAIADTNSGIHYATSTDGKVWTDGDADISDGSNVALGLAYSESLGLFIATGSDSNGGVGWKSSDGTTWTKLTDSNLTGNQYLNGCAWSPEKKRFITGGKNNDGDGAMLWSDDGDTWTVATAVYA